MTARVQAVLVWATISPGLAWFRKYLVRHYGLRPADAALDLLAAEAAPRAHVAAAVYLPPALRPGAVGW